VPSCQCPGNEPCPVSSSVQRCQDAALPAHHTHSRRRGPSSRCEAPNGQDLLNAVDAPTPARAMSVTVQCAAQQRIRHLVTRQSSIATRRQPALSTALGTIMHASACNSASPPESHLPNTIAPKTPPCPASHPLASTPCSASPSGNYHPSSNKPPTENHHLNRPQHRQQPGLLCNDTVPLRQCPSNNLGFGKTQCVAGCV